MKIWLIQTGEPLPLNKKISKMRTSILADKLVERGHDVLWWAGAFDHFNKKWLFKNDMELKLKKNLTIKAIKGTGYRKNISISRFIDHRVVAGKFRTLSYEMPKPDIIIASTPSYDLAYEAVLYAKRNNIPVLVDIRDEWPDIFLNHVPQKLHVLARSLLYKEFRMIRKTMKLADGVIAMMNTLLEWGLCYAEREKDWKDRVFYLGSKKSLPPNKRPNKIRELIDDLNNKFVVTFVGTVVFNNNPTILIECAKQIDENNICFVIAGDGDYFNEIRDKSLALDNVILPGWLEQYEIDVLLRNSHVGLCPTTVNRGAFPNKVFTYLSYGLPIVSAFQGEMKENIEKYKIGFYYPPNDVETLVGYIKKLYDDPSLCKEMSENALKIFHEKFDANKIYKEYAQHIESVGNDYKYYKHEEKWVNP